MTATLRHMPSYVTVTRTMNYNSKNVRKDGRNIDGMAALKLTAAEADAVYAAARQAMVDASDEAWAAQWFDSADEMPFRGVSRPTARAWRAYMTCRDLVSLVAAEAALQTTIGRA